MKINNLSQILILIILVFGLILLMGCNQSKKEATPAPVNTEVGLLIGSWSNDEGIELSVFTFENGSYTIRFGENLVEKGTYTLNDGKLTKVTTHVFLKDSWMSREEFGELGADVAVLEGMFETQVYACTVSDDSLIFTPHPDNFDMTSLSPEEIQSEYTLRYTRLVEE